MKILVDRQELDKFARKHNLYINNEFFMNIGEYYKDFLDKDMIYNHILVKSGSDTIIEIYSKEVIKDEELLIMIKKELRQIKLKSII
jgi:hypothetical protein